MIGIDDLLYDLVKFCFFGIFKSVWDKTDLMKLRDRIEEGMKYIEDTAIIRSAPSEISEDTHGCSCFKCCVGKTGDETGNVMNMTTKLSNYRSTFSKINEHLEKLGIKKMARPENWPQKFVLKDANVQKNGDWKILFDKFEEIKESIVEPGTKLVLSSSSRRAFKDLLLEWLSVVEEIIFACHDADKHVSNDIAWFEARCRLYGNDEYKMYYDLERPKGIAEELLSVLKNHPSKKEDSQKILFINFPWGWPNLRNELWNQNKSLWLQCELYQLDYKSGTFSKCKSNCDPGEESSWETVGAETILFDTVICWHFMQHCSKNYSKLCYREITKKLKSNNGLLILFLAVSRAPEINTIAIEKSCEYTVFYKERLLGKKHADSSKICYGDNYSFLTTPVGEEEDGQNVQDVWQIDLESNDNSIYGYLLKFQNDYLIYWKHSTDVIQAGGEIISSAGDNSAELFRGTRLDDKFPSEIEIIRHEDKVILKYFGNPFLCYGYTPRHSPDGSETPTPAKEAEDIVNALWENPNKPLCFFDEHTDHPLFLVMKDYKLKKCCDYCKREFFRGTNGETSLSVDVFIHSRYDLDTEAYVRFKYNGQWYVTYFPTLVYMHERLANAKLCACERDGQYAGSVTHQISWKTLERRLADNNCRLQKIWYHNLGPRAASDPDLKKISSQQNQQDSRSIYSVLTAYLNTHSGFPFTGKIKKKLLEWDVHDAMVVACKNDVVLTLPGKINMIIRQIFKRTRQIIIRAKTF